MHDFLSHLVDKLDVKRLLFSTFLGLTLKLLLPDSFFINKFISTKISSENQEAVSFIFFISFSYVLFIIFESIHHFIEKMLKHSLNKIERINSKIAEETDLINFTNSLINYDKMILKQFLTNKNQKVSVYLGSQFITNLINNGYAKVIPNSQKDTYSQFSSFDTQVDIILETGFYHYLLDLYSKGKILKND